MIIIFRERRLALSKLRGALPHLPQILGSLLCPALQGTGLGGERGELLWWRSAVSGQALVTTC